MRPRFALSARRAGILSATGYRWQLRTLDRHLSPEPGLRDPIHFAHATLDDLSRDPAMKKWLRRLFLQRGDPVDNHRNRHAGRRFRLNRQEETTVLADT